MSATTTISATLSITCPKCRHSNKSNEELTEEQAAAAEAEFQDENEIIAFYVTPCPECDEIIPKSGFELIIDR